MSGALALAPVAAAGGAPPHPPASGWAAATASAGPQGPAFGRGGAAAQAPAIVHVAPAAAPAGPDGTVRRAIAAGSAPRGRVQRQGEGSSSGSLPELPEVRAPEPPAGPDVSSLAEQVYELLMVRLASQRRARGL